MLISVHMSYTGNIYGKLTAIRDIRAGGRGIGRIWLVKCECGNELEVPLFRLRDGKKRACANCSTKLRRIPSTMALAKGLKQSWIQYVRAFEREFPGGQTIIPSKFEELSSGRCAICRRGPCRGARGGTKGYPAMGLCRTCRVMSDAVTFVKFLDTIGRVIANHVKVR